MNGRAPASDEEVMKFLRGVEETFQHYLPFHGNPAATAEARQAIHLRQVMPSQLNPGQLRRLSDFFWLLYGLEELLKPEIQELARTRDFSAEIQWIESRLRELTPAAKSPRIEVSAPTPA